LSKLSRKNRYSYKKEKKQNTTLKKISSQNIKIEGILRRRSGRPSIIDETTIVSFPTSSVFEAHLLHPIESTNLKQMVLQINDENFSDLPTRLICTPAFKAGRFNAGCTRLLLGKREYKVDFTVRELDGSLGVTAQAYDTQLTGFAESVATDALEGSLEKAGTNLKTKFTGSKSLGLAALSSALRSVKENSSIKRNQQKVYFLRSGRKMLIYLNRSLAL
jgi:hypothetical protein